MQRERGGRIGRTSRFQYANRTSQIGGRPYEPKNGVHASGSNSTIKRSYNPIKHRGVVFGGLKPIPNDRALDPPPRACYNCWQRGHAQRDCPRPTVAQYCNNCGRRGEEVKSCPRCKVAFVKFINQVKAKNRGEVLDPKEVEMMMPESSFGEDDEEEDENEDGCDEVLRELMYEQARKTSRFIDDRRNTLAAYGDRDAYNERDPRRDLDARYADRQADRSREQRYESDVDRQLELQERRNEEEREREYREWREQKAATSKQSACLTTASGAQITSDPVQDILLLAKSIAHLSPETQDLIMRQVISERKEHQATLKAIQVREEDVWP